MVEPVRTTCPYCGTGCGVLAQPGDGGAENEGWAISGDPDHPANFGRLCSKGRALGDTLAPDTRLHFPMVDGRRVSWDHAIAETAGRIRSVVDLHGPDAFAFYLSGQLLTEDYYAANKLAKGFIGTANVDTNSRLCMASTVAGHRRAFGSDTVPGCYEDIDLADLVVLVGSNLAWCHPVLFQRLKLARETRGTRVVVIDPRRTDCCDIADLHLAVAADGDVALFNNLLVHCHDAGLVDRRFVDDHTNGFAQTLKAAREQDAPSPTPEEVAFFQLFAKTQKVVTIFSQGVNQSSSGTDKVNAILNVHLALGRIGKPGCGPFSVTGQPNAMGGREVGGLANQLAAHMGFDKDSLDRVGRFWDAPRMAVREGLKAVDLFHAIDAGKVKAVWIMGTNPAVSLPEADLVRRALAKCPVVVVSDCVDKTDTQVFAHIRLPALAWGEKNGTVTNSERTISRLRPFMEPLPEARADWWAVARVGQELGWKDAFAWSGPGEVFKEYAGLTAFENDGARDLDLGFVQTLDYDALEPVQWGERRHFADGRFFTPDGKANLVPVSPRPMADAVDRFYPLRLNSGRYRDQWHTMTRTGLSARLSGHRPEPLVDMHPEDAAAALLKDGALARVESRFGTYVAKVRVTEDQRRGDVFVPMHWNDHFAAHAVSGRLFGRAVDPVSGQPASKAGAVRVAPYRVNWSGLLIARDAPRPDGVEWWVRHRAAAQGRQDSGDVVELAGTNDASRRILVDHLSSVFGEDRMEVVDPARKTARFAWFEGNRLIAALYLSPEPPEVLRGWLLGMLGDDALQSPVQRLSVLAGSAPGAAQDQGPVVCACFGVGLQTIKSAIIEQKLSSVEEIGAALKAGTGCGSCVPELRTLLSFNAPLAPACAKAIA